jgi:hypothetical protein
MIEPKVAVEKSAKYYRDATSDTGRLVLEELELSDDKKKWHVTLSHANPADQAVSILMGTQTENRLYKAFVVDATSGDVLSMKVKKIS